MANLSIFEIFPSLAADLEGNDRRWHEIDESSFDYMLDILPPLAVAGGGYITSEPYTHLPNGEGVYLACVPSKESHLLRIQFFAAYLTLKEFKSASLSGFPRSDIPKYTEK